MRGEKGREDEFLDRIVPRLLDETIAVVETLSDWLGLKYPWSLRETRQNWRDRARDFWRDAAPSPCS